MIQRLPYRITRLTTLALSLVVLALVSMTATAQSVKVEGVIKSRSGDIMIVQTPDSLNLVFLLTDATEVGQVQGMLKARRKEMSMAALIPGLTVTVEGVHEGDKGQILAKSVKFKGNDLERAQAIQAGTHETKMQAEQNKEALEQQKALLAEQQQKINANQEAIAANKAAVDAAVARFGQLDDYYIFDEVSVYFANGKVNVDPQYNPQLMALTEKAKTINGYMIEVTGYASSSGSAAKNQKLSEDRANNVTNFLLQQGHVPITRMLAPAAMGESQQAQSGDKTAEAEKENRKVVVRVLQNKAISGT